MSKHTAGMQLKPTASYMTPKQRIAHAQRARWRFKAAVRFVLQNLYWLDDADDQVLGENVQKNVLVLTRQREKQSLLTLQDKGILNKPAQHRTEAEKLHLSQIIGGLKCFRQYPVDVKSQLPRVTYFFCYGPGRTIVRQGHKSDALYFVVTGSLTVSQESYDPMFKEIVRKDVATMIPGSMFGEVALLHDIPRTATVTTNTHVELLCVKKKDFEIVLKATVQEQWTKVQQVMSCFSYFEGWNKIQIRECCIYAKLKTFLPNHTVLGDGFGYHDHVYFILKGRCKVVEHLLVSTVIKNNKKCYKLYVPPLEDLKLVDSKVSLPKSEKMSDMESSSSIQSVSEAKSLINSTVSRGGSEGNKNGISSLFKTESKKEADEQRLLKKTKISRNSYMQKSVTEAVKSHIEISSVKVQSRLKHVQQTSTKHHPSSVETHFMQVCFLGSTACFAVGENMNHRRVVAVEQTECLLIPRYWLMQHNKGNIWNRVQQFLNKHIPTTEQVFSRFVNQRRWLAYRKKLVDDILADKKKANVNKLSNVPYSIRMNAIDFQYY